MGSGAIDHGVPGAAARYLPIAEHGLIGDLRTVALVGTDGTIDWYCCPSFDAPSVFASILDADRGGSFELAADAPAKTKQFYFPDTNVLITRFFTEDGVGEVQDFMPVAAPRLIRRVVCVRGSMAFRAVVAPRFGFGAQPHTVSLDPVRFVTPDLTLAFSATVPVSTDGRDVTARFSLTEGDTAVFTLEPGDSPRGCPQIEAEREFEDTVAYWRRWLSASRYRGRWRETVH